MTLKIVPVSKLEANQFVTKHHRHNLPASFAILAVGVADGDDLAGVALAGLPRSRMLMTTNPLALEVLRTCTTGERNANSMLYGAMARAAKALGYKTLFTYTLEAETGASLKAAGWTVDGHNPGEESWSRPSRYRCQTDLFGEERRPTGPKIRWKKEL